MINNLIAILKQNNADEICGAIGGNPDKLGCHGVYCADCPFCDEHNMAKLIKQLKEVSDGQQHSN